MLRERPDRAGLHVYKIHTLLQTITVAKRLEKLETKASKETEIQIIVQNSSYLHPRTYTALKT